jgi:hypothetical protein
MSKTYCSEVLSATRTPRVQSQHPNRSEVATDPPQPQAKVLLIAERVNGFFLQRFTDRGEHIGDTQHETLDEAMSYAYSQYDAISDWRFCPDGVNPLEYIHARSNP